MGRNEILEKLKLLIQSGVKVSAIEVKAGLPKNNLSGVLAGKKKFPEKWVGKLEFFLNDLEQPKQEVVAVEDGSGSWSLADGTKIRLVFRQKNQSIQDLTSQTQVIKPAEQPKTNYVIKDEYGQNPDLQTQDQIAALEKELAAIPDTTKGLGKTLAASIKKKIANLKK